MAFHKKLLLVQNHCVQGSINLDGFVRNYDGARYLALFGPKRIWCNLQ